MEEKRERKKAQNKEVQANEYTKFNTEYAEEIGSYPKKQENGIDQEIDEDYSDY